MKRNSFLLLVCCAALLATGKPAHSQMPGPAPAGVETAVDPELEKAQTAWHQAAAEAIENHLRTVAARGDSRSLLAAAMLWPQWQDDVGQGKRAAIAQEKRAWFDAARNARPRDPLVAWVEASGCFGLSDSCDRDDALRFLLQTDPDNAAVQTLAMVEADRSGTPVQVEALWQSAALASTYDARTLQIGQLLYSSMQEATLPPLSAALARLMGQSLGMERDATPEDMRDINAMAVWTAVALPAYQTITRRCSADALASLPPQHQAQCERVMTLLAEDETILISPMIGLRKMVELAGGRADGESWRERLRQFHWVYENAQRSMSSSAEALPPEYISWVLLEGELPAMRRLLEINGIPTVAPEDWLPERAEIRALLMSTAAKG